MLGSTSDGSAGGGTTATTDTDSGPDAGDDTSGSATNATTSAGSGSDDDDDGSDTDTDTGSVLEVCNGALAPLGMLAGNEGVVSDQYEVRLPVGGMAGRMLDHCGSSVNALFTAMSHSENNFGVTEFPLWNIWSEQDPAVTVLESGPAVVRMRVDWAVNVDVDPEDEAYGTSTYTFIADGRIVRDEDLVYSEATNDTMQNWLTAYLALEPNRFTQVEVRGDADITSAVDQQEPAFDIFNGQPSQDVTFCARHEASDDVVGFTGRRDSDVTTEWNGLRATEAEFFGPRSLSFIGDFETGNGVGGDNITPGTYRGYFLTTLGGNPGADCARVHEHGAEFLSPSWLVTEGGTYDSFHDFSGAHLLSVSEAGDLTVQIPVGSAMPSVLFDVADYSRSELQVAGVAFNGTPLEEDTQFITQFGSDRGHWILVGQRLVGGDEITITYVE